jgi:dual specificity tyrosine-phosphorylation-regulated kinase 2/3/4
MNTSNQSSLISENSMNLSHFSPKNESLASWTDLHLPTSPLIVIGKFREKLSKFELAEILKFSQVFCIGIDAEKHESNGNALENYGFDDESGDYRVSIHDHIAYRYEILEVLGKGSFGQVFRVFDFKNKCFCALKVIKNRKRFNQQAVVEIDILRHLRKVDEDNSGNVVHIQSSFSFRSHIVILT